MLIQQGKTNWNYILIIVILAVIVGGGTLWCATRQEAPFYQSPEVKILENEETELCSNSEYNTEYIFIRPYYFNDQKISLTRNSMAKLAAAIEEEGNKALEGIADLTCLEYLTLDTSDPIPGGLRSGGPTARVFNIANKITDISALANLKNLRQLSLDENKLISDISVLSGMKKLEVLYIYSLNVSDLLPISGLKNLKYLSVGGNDNIISIFPLRELTNLEELILRTTSVSDISPLSGLNLKKVYLDNNKISNADALLTLKKLEFLRLIDHFFSNESCNELKKKLKPKVDVSC